MRAQVQFKEELASLESPISTLESAVNEILKCETLTRILLVTLTAGNIINGVSSLPLSFSLTVSLSLPAPSLSLSLSLSLHFVLSF